MCLLLGQISMYGGAFDICRIVKFYQYTSQCVELERKLTVLKGGEDGLICTE